MSGFRLKVFALHALPSLGVGAGFIVLLLRVWYPAPLDEIFPQLTVICTAVAGALIIGALLTAVLASPGKDRELLKGQITLIVLVQITALGAGVWMTYIDRPLYIAFDTRNFFLITRTELQAGAAAPGVALPGPFEPPQLVFVEQPSDPRQAIESLIAKLSGGGSQATYQPQQYRPFAAHRESVYRAGVSYADTLAKLNEEASAQIEQLALSHPGATLRFYLLIFAEQRGILAIDTRRDKLVGYLDQVF